eukprot:gene24753-29910_t
MKVDIFNNKQARAYAFAGSVIAATIMGIKVFGERTPGRNIFEVTPPAMVEKAAYKAEEASNMIKEKVREFTTKAKTVKEKAKDVAVDAEVVTDEVTSQDL